MLLNPAPHTALAAGAEPPFETTTKRTVPFSSSEV